jgi:hypothetical protein
MYLLDLWFPRKMRAGEQKGQPRNIGVRPSGGTCTERCWSARGLHKTSKQGRSEGRVSVGEGSKTFSYEY